MPGPAMITSLRVLMLWLSYFMERDKGWGPTLICSILIHGSSLRDGLLVSSGNYMWCQGLNTCLLHERSTLHAVLFLWPTAQFLIKETFNPPLSYSLSTRTQVLLFYAEAFSVLSLSIVPYPHTVFLHFHIHSWNKTEIFYSLQTYTWESGHQTTYSFLLHISLSPTVNELLVSVNLSPLCVKIPYFPLLFV